MPLALVEIASSLGNYFVPRDPCLLQATYHHHLQTPPASNHHSCPSISPAHHEKHPPLSAMTTTDLVFPPPNLPPASALRLSQLAPRVLSTSTTSSLPWPLSLLTSTETQETWASHENLLLSCLRTGDEKSARQCLDRLKARFGEENQRVVALRFLYESAVAPDDKDLRRVLEELNIVLKVDPTSLVSFLQLNPGNIRTSSLVMMGGGYYTR